MKFRKKNMDALAKALIFFSPAVVALVLLVGISGGGGSGTGAPMAMTGGGYTPKENEIEQMDNPVRVPFGLTSGRGAHDTIISDYKRFVTWKDPDVSTSEFWK
jgi:hypothetical protein